MARAATIVRGLLAGFIGATILALWFLLIDILQGQPFSTPAFLSSVLAQVDGMQRSLGLIMYTALHYGAFFLVGLAVVWLMSRLEAAPSVLLGAVLGFLLFDVVFYSSVALTGVDVVERLGWVQVLLGNVLAGMAMMVYLRRTLEVPKVSWLELLAQQQIVREGTIAGLIGAGSVAVWFLVFDLISRRVFFTPGALGSALFFGVSDLADVRVTLLTVGGYSLVHLAAFIAAGLVAATLAVQAERTPPILLGAVLLFAAFEAFFLGALAILAEWLLGALAWWTIALGNLIATVTMAYYLWQSHPKLREAVREGPLAAFDR